MNIFRKRTPSPPTEAEIAKENEMIEAAAWTAVGNVIRAAGSLGIDLDLHGRVDVGEKFVRISFVDLHRQKSTASEYPLDSPFNREYVVDSIYKEVMSFMTRPYQRP